MEKYNHKRIEERWQEVWEKDGLYKTEDKARLASAKVSAQQGNFYQLVEFPYPSGNLHVGHWYAFSVPDIFVRAKRMQGYNVMYPIGFDAFGLPAENAAIKHNVNPREWTEQNIEHMKKQIRSMGASFDWSREVQTIDPKYYKWTQWMFLKFFEKGLAYQAETSVNWCPSCKTVLANEQVVSGMCERCGTEVNQKKMKQWMLKITDYAEKLLEGLDKLDKWPEEIKNAQRNWIGKSEGALLKFPIANDQFSIEVFTTRPDTVFGATYMVVAPEHSIIANDQLPISNKKEVDEYVKKASKKTELERIAEGREKTGVEIKGIKAINPATKEEIPIFIADYVLGNVGTGAIMAVPAHDQRDFDFAKKYQLEIREVVSGGNIADKAFTESGKLVNSGEFDGLDSEEVKKKIIQKFGQAKITYRMRDWVLSRQRYWGTPIPIIHCEKCGAVADDNLPVKLPELNDFKPKDDGRSPLSKAKDWVNTKCPQCGGEAERETDTMDTFVDSSWYFLRYCDPKNEKEFAASEKIKNWLPVNRYSGGAEHTTMHLLYSRFWIKAMYDLDMIDFDEPYTERMNRGLILGPDGAKMSKSKGNVIDPDEIVELLGADTVRMYLAFIGPYNEVGSYPWDVQGIKGIRKFLEKTWLFFQNVQLPITNFQSKSKSQFSIHKTIKKVTEDIESFKFNTAIARLMEELKVLTQENSEVFLKLLSPFAPHMTEEIWREVLGHKTSIHLEKWPEYESDLIKDDIVKIPVQINGRVRTDLEVAVDASEQEIKEKALAEEKVKKYLEGKKIKKAVYVKGKIINFVV